MDDRRSRGRSAATFHVPAVSAVKVRAMVTLEVTCPWASDGMLRSVAAIGETVGPEVEALPLHEAQPLGRGRR